MNPRSTRNKPSGYWLKIFLGILTTSMLHAQNLSDYPFEDLVNVPVVASSKQSERLFDAPASAFVFDEEAIEFLPVDSVPEMLRYAPGVNITRATNGIWGLGIRGMNSRFLGRVLFTVDEQNIFSTLYAGLFGSQHDLFLPDVSSIEVVYGPGGTLWGTNAANGMVNVIMKSTFETEDTVLLAQFGSMNQIIGARSGWSVGSNTSARVYAKYGSRDESESPLFSDAWETIRAGFQIDHRLSSRDLLTLSSEIYSSDLGWAQQYAWKDTGEVGILDKAEKQEGINLQTKWNHQTDANNGFTLRTWTGFTNMDSGYVSFDLGLLGTELRSRFSPNEDHQFIFTIGGTLEYYDMKNTDYSVFHDDYEKDSYTLHAGTEYTYSAIPDRLDLTAGINFDYGSHTETTNFLPSLRLMYRPNEKTRLWASFSRAARPVVAGMNDVEEILYGVVSIDPITIPTPLGNLSVDQQHIYGISYRDFEPEKLDAFEIGLRYQINSKMSVRANAYHYAYRDAIGGVLESSQPVLTVQNPYIRTEYRITNTGDGTADGFELSTDLQLSERTKLVASFAAMVDDFDPIVSSDDIQEQVYINRSVDIISNSNPDLITSAWWVQKWSDAFRTDLGLRFTSGYENLYGSRSPLWQADLKASWKPNEHFRISLVGRNLLKEYTSEAPLRDMLSIPTEQPREWYLEVRYQF